MLLSAFLNALLVWRWVVRLGGLGLILIGIADNSVVPLTGSMDVLTIWLAARQPALWPYYVFMATLGAVLGGYITYALARKGGKEALAYKFNGRKAEKLIARLQRWQFWTVFTGAILPPPFPVVPVVVTAGATQYPRKNFLMALTSGRAVRYSILAGLGAFYGDSIVSFFARYFKPALAVLIGLAVIGGVASLVEYLRSRRSRRKFPPHEISRQRAA